MLDSAAFLQHQPSLPKTEAIADFHRRKRSQRSYQKNNFSQYKLFIKDYLQDGLRKCGVAAARVDGVAAVVQAMGDYVGFLRNSGAFVLE